MVDRETVVRVQRGLLLHIVAGLVAILPEPDAETVLRRVHLTVLETLRPAESAVRRLIEILAHGLVVKPGPRRAPPSGRIPRGKKGRRGTPAFPLFDPRKHPKPDRRRKSAPGVGPQAGTIGIDPHVTAPATPPVLPDDPVPAGTLLGRVAALRAALADLPKQARRLARMYARGKAKWLRVMRPGRPPGHRARGTRLVDEVLRDCHWFALEVLREPVDEPVPP